MEHKTDFEEMIETLYVIAVGIFLITGLFICAFGSHVDEQNILRYGIGLLTLLTFINIKEKGP